MADQPTDESTYPLRAASRITGLSPELLRAWERRYGVVEPLRTPGGTRRYRASDLERLKLVKAAVDAGHRIGRVAQLDLEALKRAVEPASTTATPLEPTLLALQELRVDEVQRLLSLQLAALGPVRFAREFAVPLVHAIGDRWANGQLSVASEHLATASLRAILGSALQPTAVSRLGPAIVFATPSGERHELGLQVAALTALGAGASVIYLGAELPVEELLGAVENTRASVLALSLVTIAPATAARMLAALRGGLADQVLIWIGGSGSTEVALPDAVERIESLEDLEQRVTLLGYERPGTR